ncbi:LysM peptidoglycan-binding domain-containing protein [Dysgonomonas sp. 511]|uniref:LysM peptidoglycan-binding domain-containing protein n=1 Tax=Dysgonomonas sp. 511 TaxID=2302930 RepID=UPI0013D2DC8A|nr:LysM peptidoglycan-binding domain-containing protein [Dysgonomonas sp. 511]NDV78300.1 LysM peptidoglycan-binding domain-containing protein [Dysgonomonas sp. 511]
MNFIRKTIVISILLHILCAAAIYSHERPGDLKDDGNIFSNQALLNPLFDKLLKLEKNKQGKVNIVHIGDSHIQADFFTNAIRQALQQKFGNGGVGFSFPYRLIGTNGPRFVRYTSNAGWHSLLNVSPVADVGMGLSGIALYTSAEDFILQLSPTDGYEFNTVKIIYPTIEPQYKVSVTADALVSESAAGSVTASGYKSHKVRSGESLSSISRKYKVGVAQIKKANGLRSNTIHPGRRLKIPVRTKVVPAKAAKSNIEKDSLEYTDLVSKPYYSSFTSDTLIERVTILPAQKQAMYNLNGFVVENNHPGVIYHSIGVNGAKITDYAKYPLFFKQLPILQPDLIILSFGTNESFGKISDSDYIFQLKQFVDEIKKLNKDAIVLVMTPPPSMFRRGRTNTYISDYSIALMGLTYLPVWDLYTRMGGASGISAKGEYARMIARDKVHYTAGGYSAQGQLFASDFIDAYTNFKKNREN